MDTKMIGGKIARARKKANMSQANLAQLLFISPQAVGKWERGESIPDIITFNRLAEILGVDLNYFSENFRPADVEQAGDNEASTEGDNSQPQAPEQQLLTNFSGSNLANTDFAGVAAHKMKFHGSALSGSNFSSADLTASSFKACDMSGSNFDDANLTDCLLYANNIADGSFNKTILVRTAFNASGLAGARFTHAKLVDAQLVKTDLRKTIFENCVFEGVDFNYSDLRGVCLDGQTFTGVKFHNAALNEVTLKGATLRNVSFRSTFALTNKYYRAISTISFDGATMDKLTYAALKGMGADLSKVTII